MVCEEPLEESLLLRRLLVGLGLLAGFLEALGVFTFRYVPEKLPASGAEAFLNKLNTDLVARAIASRQIMISSTRLDSRQVIRLCVLNHRTRKEDVHEALRLIERFGREAEEGRS